MKKLYTAIASFVLCASGAFAKTLTIGIDVSESNPLVSSPAFASVAGKYVRTQVAQLHMLDVVEIRTIGDRSMANFKTERIQINRHNRPDKAADMVARYIAGLPNKTHEGNGSTNLIAFMEFSSNFDCANGGRILLLTDGIESSDYISSEDFLSGKPLSKPDSNFLAGCEVSMLGFGQNANGEWPPQVIKNMRKSWNAWMKDAGATFTPIINP